MSISQWTHPGTGETRFYVRGSNIPKKTYVNSELKVVNGDYVNRPEITPANLVVIEALLLRYIAEIGGFWVATAPKEGVVKHTQTWLEEKLETTRTKFREVNAWS